MLKNDCSNFKGDRPCSYNKDDGIMCNNCNYYQPILFRILIVKLDAIGDVLRTTSILKPLKKKYPECYIEWCTKQNASDLFKNNSLVNEVITIEDDAFFRISAEEYDVVINLDTSKLSSAIAAAAKAKEKFGFILNKKGYVEATSPKANIWLEMSAFDSFKKLNVKSYQKIMYEILGFNSMIERPIIQISQNIKLKIANRDFAKSLNSSKPVIGLNVGIGTKWPSKGWPLKNWEELIKLLARNDNNLLLLGGPEEVNVVKYLTKKYKFLIDTGCDNSLLEFAAIVDLCDLVVTADSLALHMATALDKKIIALFGPTSISEIELYGKGIKLRATSECKCFYRKYCMEEVSCMEKIHVTKVMEAINTLLK